MTHAPRRRQHDHEVVHRAPHPEHLAGRGRSARAGRASRKNGSRVFFWWGEPGPAAIAAGPQAESRPPCCLVFRLPAGTGGLAQCTARPFGSGLML